MRFARLAALIDSAVLNPDPIYGPNHYKIIELHDAQLGDVDLKPDERAGKISDIGTLTLDQRVAIYLEFKGIGKRYIANGNLGGGGYFLSVAHYLWQNFIVMDGEITSL